MAELSPRREGRDQPPRAGRPRAGDLAGAGRGGCAPARRRSWTCCARAANERDADERARQRTALASVAAAVLLVTVKLVTGLVTGSLAFVAEAVHSGTDLVAALLTLFAVRVAVRPPDREHHYGHGKAEHLAALGESAFLILVSVAIGVQAHRAG